MEALGGFQFVLCAQVFPALQCDRHIAVQPEEVVECALNALDAGGGLAVPRLLNKMTVWLQRFLPRSVVMKATSRIFRPS